MQLGNQIRRLGKMKCAAADEQDVIGFDHAVFGADRGAFDQRQQIALHALTRYLRAAGFAAAGDFVNLVQKHDAVLLDVFHRIMLEVVLVHHLQRFFLGEQLERFAHREFALLLAPAAEVLEHAL